MVEGLEEAVGEVLLLEEVEQEVAEEELHLAEEEGRVLSAVNNEVEWGKMLREILLEIPPSHELYFFRIKLINEFGGCF